MFVGGGDAQEVCVKCRGPSGDLLFSQRGLNSISREADPDPFTSCCLSEVIFFDLLSVSGSDVTDPTGIVKIQWRLKTHMRFWNKYDGLLNQVVKAWRIGRSSEKKKSSGNGTQIWNIMRTWPIAPFLLSAQIILWFQSRMGPNHRGQAADNEVLLLHDNRWKNKGSEKDFFSA
ncbi:uncharacterized protein isoform X6 [Danio rerio]|uniref:Uncharacterized protein isoform X6 n=1 Tax=Danio rerio TaxID=7955 RepID=A0AC58GGH6_DANRE